MGFHVRLLSMPFSTRNNTYAIGDYSQYVVSEGEHEVQSNLIDMIQIQPFEGMDKVSHVQIIETGDVYDVTNILYPDERGRTTFEYSLEYNPVMSLIKPTSMLTGVFERLPTAIQKWQKESIITDAKTKISESVMPKLPADLVWIEIVTKERLEQPEGQAIRRYGMFAKMPFDSGRLSADNVATLSIGSKATVFMSMIQLINNFSDITSKSTDIIDTISVSERCPFTYNVTQNPLSANLSNIPPTVIFNGDPANYALYPIDGFPTTQSNDTFSVTVTDDVIKYGSVSIVNEQDNIIAEIPTELIATNSLSFRIETRSDLNSLVTEIYCNETKSMVQVFNGKLPWVGNAWIDYQSRDMDKNRSSTEFAIAQSKEQRNINAVSSIANAGIATAIKGSAGLATLGAGLITAEMQRRLDERKSLMELEIDEKWQKDQLSNFSSTGMGLLTMLYRKLNGLRVCQYMPANMTPEYTQKYHLEYGYKTEGVNTIAIQNGYYKGRLTIPLENGVKNDLLNSRLMEGIKLTVI